MTSAATSTPGSFSATSPSSSASFTRALFALFALLALLALLADLPTLYPHDPLVRSRDSPQ